MVDRTTGITNQRVADEYDADLEGARHANQGRAETSRRAANDVKSAHGVLGNMSDEDLRQIPILDEGVRLEEGSTYLDLADPVPTEIVAHGVMEAGHGHLYVAKSEVDYELWNRLRGVDDPDRTRPTERGSDQGEVLT